MVDRDAATQASGPTWGRTDFVGGDAAGDAAGDAGYVPTVRTETRREADRLGETVAHVVVSDNGSGIADAVQARILEPSVTTKAPEQGTGLSVAHDIALGHGGMLVAGRDERTGGAAFTVTLPLAMS